MARMKNLVDLGKSDLGKYHVILVGIKLWQRHLLSTSLQLPQSPRRLEGPLATFYFARHILTR